MKIGVASNHERALRQLSNMPKQIPFALASALTASAQKVREAEKLEMQRVFDRPTRFTVNSLFMDRATKTNLSAVVYFKQPRSGGKHYLLPQVFGGVRPQKQFEKRLQNAGLLPRGWVTRPGKAARLDGSGNMSRGQINQVLSVLQAQGDSYSNTSARSAKRAAKKPRAFFASTRSGRARARNGGQLPLGVWEHVGTKQVRNVLLFLPQASYRKRFPFFDVALRIHRVAFPELLQRSINRAVETARVA